MKTKTEMIEAENYHVMQKQDIDAFADCLAHAFEGYSLFEYFSNKKYNVKRMKFFWKVVLKTSGKRIIGISDCAEPKALAFFYPENDTQVNILSYIRAGGWQIPFLFGFGKMRQMLNFEAFAQKIKEKYVSEHCGYLYGFVVLPEYRHHGLATQVLSPMLTYFDRIGKDCYLETLEEKNVALYEHYGFSLMESTTVPGTDLKVYAMLRKSREMDS